MPEKVIHLHNIQGLSDQQVNELREKYGENIFHADSSGRFIHIIWDIIKEPMFILLAIACSLYFILNQPEEGFLMLLAMIFVSAISFYQEVKSSNALKALKQYTEPKVRVIRNAEELTISSQELVPGDIILLEEGMNIPADAVILEENDFTVNESIITGESLPADKEETEGKNLLYQGTTINSGKCTAKVTTTGNNTVLGKLGKSLGSYNPPKTMLQQQINVFVRRLALFGLLGFFIIFIVNYLNHGEWVISLLFALTLAMSAVPEEIPVAFSSFMALGAYKMSKLGIISRQPQVVENLGAVSVICFDKTGTITENKMQVKTIYDFASDALIDLDDSVDLKNKNVLRFGVLASEKNPFDAMEKAIWEAFYLFADGKGHEVQKMIFEYPLEGQPPMMTHVYEINSVKVAAGKGAGERIIAISKLKEADQEKIAQHIKTLASKGYRVIAVSSAVYSGLQLPAHQNDFDWQFEGLLALYDPPKKNIREVLKKFDNAKIDVKLITGDYPETAINIGGQVGIPNHLKFLSGEQVMSLSTAELQQKVNTIHIFARMFPDAKLKVIEALKANGEIVAMTGDGVNDGPALKSASIGIAMGQKGTEIARQASDLILTDDNMERMVTALYEGRKIFSNLKKAVRYIISIHIPIVLVASLPVILGWTYPNIFTPIHVIFMELIMGPTCSIFFEREPVEENIMQQGPRERKGSLFTRNELLVSIIQGLMIAAGALILYFYYMSNGSSLEQTRTIVFTMLILSNIFLTFANRSFTKTLYYTVRYKNNLAPYILIISAFFLICLHFVPYVRNVFQLSSITLVQFWNCFGVALLSVFWFELYKIRFLHSAVDLKF
ncbi:cation-translocating P-type ATPase [Daejeonella oryzae]|uniref:cation-translocating P-type ATPase n=1 Tax=Daejeonella oryzae TaxID=1122943 RepID=UPI0003FD90D9|nr:cation-translocating P-type ATPase [Daejeonella oryzae]